MSADQSAVLAGPAESRSSIGGTRMGAHDRVRGVHDGADPVIVGHSESRPEGQSLPIPPTHEVRDLPPTSLVHLLHHDVASGHYSETRVTSASHDSIADVGKSVEGSFNGICHDEAVRHSNLNILAASSLTPPQSPPFMTTTITLSSTQDSVPLPELPLPKSNGITNSKAVSREGTMIFGLGGASGQHAQLAQHRRSMANTSSITEYEADLTSQDRAQQKEAVRRFLCHNIQSDWTWDWPKSESSFPKEDLSQLKVNGAEGQYKERDEWVSDGSGIEDHDSSYNTTSSPTSPKISESLNSPFRFESPDALGDAIQKRSVERKRWKQKRHKEEQVWNDGLRCFVQRRDTWTCARHIARRPSSRAPALDGANSSPRIPIPTPAADETFTDDWETIAEIPIAPPLLPSNNPMRASITPAAYNVIYDKVVLQSMTPSCPMNLKDVTRSCVQGWKRDGEWPPKSTVAEDAPIKKKKVRKLSVAGIWGLDKEKKEKEGESPTSAGGIRRGLQKIFSLGQSSGSMYGGPLSPTGKVGEPFSPT
ncbi:hypothetical protein B7494_g6013 [Chlorociboria aeruginascens]|nr:hypothetical protein B7494_g6013 [Chlorociboria aeruginascens]